MPGSTPVFGFPYPDPSDLVANYPALGQQLAEDVEDEIIAAGQIKQIVRATDTTARSTTSTSYGDVTGMTVTITPTSATSKVLIIMSAMITTNSTNTGESRSYIQITTSANAGLSGAEEQLVGGTNLNTSSSAILWQPITLTAWVVPGVTTAVTYKVRFKTLVAATTLTFNNATSTGQIYAIEVAG